MTLKATVQQDLQNAMRRQDAVRIATLRLLLAAITQKEIARRKKAEGLDDAEGLSVVRAEVKRRIDAAEAFLAAGRQERALQEEAERQVLASYLPSELHDDELKCIAQDAFIAVGASGPADFGKIMREAVLRVAGRADGSRIADAVKHAISAH